MLLGKRLEVACQGRQEAHLGASLALEESELEELVQEWRMSEGGSMLHGTQVHVSWCRHGDLVGAHECLCASSWARSSSSESGRFSIFGRLGGGCVIEPAVRPSSISLRCLVCDI